jgi:hypothetical protein
LGEAGGTEFLPLRLKKFFKEKTKKGGAEQVHPLHPELKSVRPLGVCEGEAGDKQLNQLTFLEKGGSL